MEIFASANSMNMDLHKLNLTVLLTGPAILAHFLSYYISWHPKYVSWLLFIKINLQFQNSTLIVSCYYLLKFNSQQIFFDWFLQIV